MSSIISRLAFRYINRQLFQSVLFIIGVALGVAVVIAIDLANGSASRAFDLSAQSITGKATHQITGGPSGVPTDLYQQLRVDYGLRDTAPLISEYVQADGVSIPLRLLGVDPFAEPPFRDYLTQVNVLSDEQGGDAFTALTTFITQPGTIIISQGLADRAGVAPGDALTLTIGANTTDVRIIGLVQPADNLSQQALDDLILTDIATAQEITGFDGRLSQIDLILPPDYDIATLRDTLPDGVMLNSTAGQGNALDQMTAAFEINLQALSLLAVVVGVFLIYNTVTFSVIQRRPMIGIMRSVGATRRQVFAFVIGEAFTLGLAGTILGLGLGIIFGRAMIGLVTQTISDLYFTVNVSTLSIDPFTLVKGAALGIAASVGAAIIPSWDATRTAPAGSMQRSSLEEQTQANIPAITAAAIAFFIVGVLLLQIPTTSLIISFGALFCVIFGGALLTPIMLTTSMRLFTPIVGRVFGVLGRMATRAVVRSLSRTAVAVAALTIAVSVIIGVSVMIGSFRNTVANWLDNTLAADIYISPPGTTSSLVTTDMNPIVRDLVADVDGITRISASRTVQVSAPDYPDLPPVNLNAVDFDLAGSARGFVWSNADNPQSALEAGQIMVSEPFAFRRNITPDNNTLTLMTDNGQQTFEIFGVFYDYSTDQGTVFMSRDTYDQYWDDTAVSAVAAFVAPSADLDAVISQLQNDTLADYTLIVQSNRDLRASVFDVFDRTFTITIALRLLATLVAFIGILSALMALQLEHTREYGVMRATGMTPMQLRTFTLLQTGFMGTVAGVLAVPLGIVLAIVLIYVINVRSFGWTMQFTILPAEVLQAFAVAIGAALLAGIYPAFKLARMNTSRALRSE